MSGLPGRSEGLEMEGCVWWWWRWWWGWRREKRDGERLSKQLLIPLSVASSPSPLLLHPCCQKAERDQRRPTWKASLRFCFSVPCLPALSVTDMEMLNPKYSLCLGCRECLASSDFLSFFPFASSPLLSSPLVSPLHHHRPPSSALASLQQPSGFQVDSGWLAAAVTVSGTGWEWMSVSLAPGA